MDHSNLKHFNEQCIWYLALSDFFLTRESEHFPPGYDSSPS